MSTKSTIWDYGNFSLTKDRDKYFISYELAREDSDDGWKEVPLEEIIKLRDDLNYYLEPKMAMKIESL